MKEIIQEIKFKSKLFLINKFQTTEIIKGEFLNPDLVIKYYKFFGKKLFIKNFLHFCPLNI